MDDIQREQLADLLAIEIVFYNGDSEVLKRIDYLSEHFDSLLVIDNGSTNGTLFEEEEANKRYHLVRNKKNKGIAYALNQGLDYAEKNHKKYLLTLDQDSTIDADTILHMLKRQIEIKAVSVGPFFDKEQGNDKKVKYLITSGNIVEVKAARKIGGFKNELFIDCVDLDFSFNLLSHGYSMYKIGGAFMKHHIGDAQTDSPIGLKYYGHGPKRYYYNYRNNIYIYRKYFRKLPLRCMKLFASLILQFNKILFVEGDKERKISAALHGVKSGLDMSIS